MPTYRGAGSFEWRVGTGHWRWLLLGSLGVAASACWGKADEEPGEPTGGGLAPSPGVGGSSGQATTTATMTTGTTTTATAPTTTTTPTPTPTPTATTRCSDPTPLGGGWESCANGLSHRTSIESACTTALPRAEGIALDVLERLYPGYAARSGDAGVGGDLAGAPFSVPQCVQDSDCTMRPFGHCEAGSYGDGSTAVFCQYGCVVDADCGPQMVCVCGSPIGQCAPSSCSTDADCQGEGMCANYEAYPGCPQTQYACQTRRDKCVTGADCGTGQSCTVDELGDDDARHCAEPTWVCGRPFLIDGTARRAGTRERADWYPARPADAAPSSGVAITDAELRARVAQGWLDQALMEHASVAAFARFSLQLLSLGAPAELVAECARALQDEIAHAQACFALARRHSERDVGPGVLPLAGALDAQDLRAIVLGTVAEGCIGETLAALEAAEARAHCTDPGACAVLERISADETRHAALAWRFVAWALETGPASLRSDVREAFARELSAAEASTPAPVSGAEARLLGHGLMDPRLRAALRRRVLGEVIGPCAEALLGGGELPMAAASARSPEHVPS